MFEEPTPRRLAQMGGVCIQWSYLEFIVGALIWILLKVDTKVGKVVTGGLDILPRINMAINLCQVLNADKRVKRSLLSVRKQLQGGLIEKRNLVVHGQHWFLAGEAPLAEVQRGKGNHALNPLTDRDIYELVESIAALSAMIGGALVETGLIEGTNLSKREQQEIKTYFNFIS